MTTAYLENDNTSRLDKAFAAFLGIRSELDTARRKAFESLVAHLSQQLREGHTCLEIDPTARQLLLASGLATEDPSENQAFPLIIDHNLLYLQRYWQYEDRLAKQLSLLAERCEDPENLEALLDEYFPAMDTAIDWQKAAARMACQKSLCIITGGPGTGKTTTVCKILAILQRLNKSPLTIALTAPTGKAAMRLQDAVTEYIGKSNKDSSHFTHIPQTALTLHRLLGAQPPTPNFRHDAKNPLKYDLIVADEASMIDLALMSKLVDALKPGSRLILLGDKDQLSSVESGSVMADLISGLPDNTVELKHAHRFNSGIKQLANAVNRQETEAAWSLLLNGNDSVGLHDNSQLMSFVEKQRAEYLRLLDGNVEIDALFATFNQFQVLCANRHGPLGALALSAQIEKQIFGLKSGGQGVKQGSSAWYPGRPVMVTQNHPSLHLYNGDIGICLPDRQHGQIAVFFKRPDGSVKSLLPVRMPNCETVFAMTIHKAQGSEFEEVLIVLPETPNAVLTKELLYTGITRAKSAVKIMTNADVFKATLSQGVKRSSGLSLRFATQTVKF